MYKIQVINKKTKNIVEEIKTDNISQACRIEKGLLINMDRKDYKTEIKRI